ncbi:DUF3043 domain-containing protein [Natronoglycomyces albus]|uniref:DUF3043 domain-containing protein n=1 Tax=Natronoglycomyces albus TaxID=2811108 RepID=A0A895XRU4_9ACTN|nr:DUF3043 domain-containing protein [Natronoglycomyces albus]QSB06422.1 DUF3043 domain-containing protein [Natronoglycomyces albus]
MAKKTSDSESKAARAAEKTGPARSSSAGSDATGKKGTPTPKRPRKAQARPPKNPPMTNKEARQQYKANKPSKQERQKLKNRQREQRARIAEGHFRGDPLYDKYHLSRDQGPERLLARDIVDSRRCVGQYFFFVALGLLILTNPVAVAAPEAVAIMNLMWILMVVAFILDSIYLCRKTSRLVFGRFPGTKQSKRGLFWYVIARSLMFRGMRMPRPRMTYKATEEDLGKVLRE